jgi:hypothetical protein
MRNGGRAGEHDWATSDEVRRAIQQLSDVDYLRLRKAARLKMGGSAYSDPAELVNQALLTPYKAALGEGGRRWKRNVNFLAFVVKTIQGLASDSRGSAELRLTGSNLVPSREGEAPRDLFDSQAFATVSAEEEILARSDTESQKSREDQLASVREFFREDEHVNWIIKGIEEDKSAQEIQSLSGMSETEYATAHRRWRRGCEKIAKKRRSP